MLMPTLESRDPFIGVGAVARNSNDTVLVGSLVWTPGCFTVHVVEHLTVGEVTRFAARCGFRSWVIESDANNMVRSIKMLVARALEASVVEDREVSSIRNSDNICYGFRQGNSVVHFLTSYAFLICNNIDKVPRFFGLLIRSDLSF